jgi:hypothetical protein
VIQIPRSATVILYSPPINPLLKHSFKLHPETHEAAQNPSQQATLSFMLYPVLLYARSKEEGVLLKIRQLLVSTAMNGGKTPHTAGYQRHTLYFVTLQICSRVAIHYKYSVHLF